MSRNNSKTSGLRYLWIPGRKKSHPKGRLNVTNKRIEYSPGHKNNEPWSLGGSKNHKNLLEAEALDSPSISGLMPVTCAVAAPNIASTTDEMPVLTENKFSVLAKIDDNNYQLPSPPRDGEKHNGNNNHVSASDLISDSTSNHNLKKIDEDLEDDLPSPPSCEDHHSDVASEHSPHKKHSSINKRRSYNNYHPEVDINSIESVSESKLQYSDSDITDGVYSNSHNNNKKRKNKKNKNSKNNGAKEEEDEKIVKCLYYTLMCCECTIS
ncbi:myb-like protein D isoform X4 [Episyrphus balteatus]|uniref:myb-like protein D isoform X4 n=1 Tax=Episyrphus balteatus TaxID=286459 RepID=UPI00248559B8|nr:myb-like protein D isoform X4 [Episyrphus balteatus]XP_055843907.1 myb-like protein D isoform X4 [Episyrphus balteatus]XP_055843908.1 myb-like protein D isoform X4 [Episyrphus balteatus]